MGERPGSRRGAAESVGAPPAITGPVCSGEAQDVPMDDGVGAQVPMDVVETSRKRNAKQAGHQQNNATRGGEQPDQGSLADAGMHVAMGDAGALGADAMALAEAYSPARFHRRTGAFGLSAGVLRSRTCSFFF